MSPARRFSQKPSDHLPGDVMWVIDEVAPVAPDLMEALTTSIAEKVEHVRAAGQDRNHTCHWPGCRVECPPARWGCKRHWFALPKRLRDRVWEVYVLGQELRMDPSEEYLTVAHEIQEWITGEALDLCTCEHERKWRRDGVGPCEGKTFLCHCPGFVR